MEGSNLSGKLTTTIRSEAEREPMTSASFRLAFMAQSSVNSYSPPVVREGGIQMTDSLAGDMKKLRTESG